MLTQKETTDLKRQLQKRDAVVRNAALEEAAETVHNSLTAAQWNVDAWQTHDHVLKTIRKLKSKA